MLSSNNNFFIEPITLLHKSSKFSLGNPNFTSLKTFLQRHALDFHEHDLAKTFVLVNPEQFEHRVCGYVTLMTSEISLKQAQKPNELEAALTYQFFPAAKLARLAVDKSFQRNGFGGTFLDWIMRHLKSNIMPHIGCRFLVVDSKLESVSFYKKYGFQFLETDENRKERLPVLFLDLHKTNLNLSSNALNYANNQSVIA